MSIFILHNFIREYCIILLENYACLLGHCLSPNAKKVHFQYIRRFLPREIDLDSVSDKDLQRIENIIKIYRADAWGIKRQMRFLAALFSDGG